MEKVFAKTFMSHLSLETTGPKEVTQTFSVPLRMLYTLSGMQRRDGVISTPTSDSGASGFKSRLGHPTILNVFVVFFSPSRQNSGGLLKSGQHDFLPYSFQFIISDLPHHSNLYMS
jgi:hypothetical protein